MKKSGTVLTILAAFAALAPAALASGEIYDDLSYDPYNGSTIAGPDALYGMIGRQESAVGFIPTQSYVLTSADLPLSYILGGDGPVTITAYSDAAGLPGTVLDSVTINTLDESGAEVYNVVFTAHPTLLAGQQYWIGASADSDTLDNWLDMPSGSDTTAYRSASTDPWAGPNSSFPALRVNGVLATPEPTNLLIVGLGAGMVLSLGLKRRISQAASAI